MGINDHKMKRDFSLKQGSIYWKVLKEDHRKHGFPCGQARDCSLLRDSHFWGTLSSPFSSVIFQIVLQGDLDYGKCLKTDEVYRWGLSPPILF